MDLDIYRNIKDRDLKKNGVFIGEGRYIVERMLRSRFHLYSILCTPENFNYFKNKAENVCPVFQKTREELMAITGFHFHRGVLAAARRPVIPDLISFLTDSKNVSRLVVLPSLSEGENSGSIIRSAAAFSFNGIIIGPQCIDPFSRKAIRCSMGAVFEIPVISYSGHESAIEFLHNQGFHIVGTTLKDSGTLLQHYQFPPKYALVFGHESEGIDDAWNTGCDSFIRIKISGKVDSLNVGTAAGIILHKAAENEKL